MKCLKAFQSSVGNTLHGKRDHNNSAKENQVELFRKYPERKTRRVGWKRRVKSRPLSQIIRSSMSCPFVTRRFSGLEGGGALKAPASVFVKTFLIFDFQFI